MLDGLWTWPPALRLLSSLVVLFLSLDFVAGLSPAQIQQAVARSPITNRIKSVPRSAQREAYGQLTFTDPLKFDVTTSYQAHNFSQLISHFPESPEYHPHLNGTFNQRYWFDAQHYKKGGPVFILDGGETSGSSRLPYLQKGILSILANATNGIGIVLEHRYYGASFPFSNHSTDNLRFLDTAQSVADGDYFARNVFLPGLEDVDLSPGGNLSTKWIIYGGSYAGVKAAFSRKLYPKTFWGGIGSSAVVEAQVHFWEYWEPIRQHADATCIDNLVMATSLIDDTLSQQKPDLTRRLKSAFGLPNVTQDVDFVSTLVDPLGDWQSKNWDPAVGTTDFDVFCATLAEVESDNLLEIMKVYAKYIEENVASLCEGEDQDSCFGTNEDAPPQIGLDQVLRPWTWQSCTEYGFFQTGAPRGRPSIVSRLVDVKYFEKNCQQAFPPGQYTKLPPLPNVDKINYLGGFSLNESRLAYIDGSYDPWLYATPHSPTAYSNKGRNDTDEQPFYQIKGGVHHWDENGYDDEEKGINGGEPSEIEKVHTRMVEFVKAWLEDEE